MLLIVECYRGVPWVKDDFAVVVDTFCCIEWLLGLRVGKRMSPPVLSTGFLLLFETIVYGVVLLSDIDWLAWPLDFKRDLLD